MDCRATRQLLNAYVDGELDLAKNLEIDQHVQECADCAQACANLRAVRAALQGAELSYPVPAGLRRRVEASLRPASEPRSALRRFPRLAIAIAASLLVGVIAGWGLGRLFALRPAEPSLTDALVASHVRSQMWPRHRVDVESSDQHTVKPWFAGKLDFPPPVADLTAQGFPLIGGRLDYVADRPVAALVYKRHDHWINLYVWRSPEDADAPVRAEDHRGYHLLHWTHGGLTYWAISDVNETELREFARLTQEKAS